MSTTPDGSSVCSADAPNHEYFSGSVTVGRPHSVASVPVLSFVAVSLSGTVATMSPCRLAIWMTGSSVSFWVAARLPPIPGARLELFRWVAGRPPRRYHMRTVAIRCVKWRRWQRALIRMQ